MQKETVFDVTQGIWIDERWLHKAGLGSRVQVEMRTGEIRIRATSKTVEEIKPSQKGLDFLKTLGDNAVVGCLENSARNHDRYLYGKQA